MTGATVPWEAFDSTHPDHEDWVNRTGRCLNRECETHAIAQNRPISPPAPAVAPESPSPVVVDPSEVSGPQNGAQQPLKFQLVRWTCGNNTFLAYPVTVGPVEPWTPPEPEPSIADRLRALADADLEAAKHGSRIQRAAAKAAARAYRLAADMIEEEQA